MVSASIRSLVVWVAAAVCLFAVSHHCFTVRQASKRSMEWSLRTPPFPSSSEYPPLQAQGVAEPSFYANGTLQGVAAVRTLHISVTRNVSSPTVGVDVGTTTCAPDAMTVVDKQLKDLAAAHHAAVTFEAVDAIDGCTTLHVHRRVQLPYAAAEGFVDRVLDVVRGDVVRDCSSVQELVEVNAGANFGVINVSLSTERNRLTRYQALYATPGLNLTDRAPLLERVMAHERRVLALEHQLHDLQAQMESLTTTVEIRLINRDVRRWEERKERALRDLHRDVAMSWWRMIGAVVCVAIGYCWMRRAAAKTTSSECRSDGEKVQEQSPIAV